MPKVGFRLLDIIYELRFMNAAFQEQDPLSLNIWCEALTLNSQATKIVL